MKIIYSLAFGIGAFFALNCGTGDEAGSYPASSATPAAAATATDDTTTSANDPTVVEVKVLGHDFAPQEVHVKANQTVRWVWVTGSHNVVSGSGCTPDGAFSSGTTETPPSTFEHTFTTAGSFPYFCDPHCAIGMKGRVIVD
jgi:plastocyanin